MVAFLEKGERPALDLPQPIFSYETKIGLCKINRRISIQENNNNKKKNRGGKGDSNSPSKLKVVGNWKLRIPFPKPSVNCAGTTLQAPPDQLIARHDIKNRKKSSWDGRRMRFFGTERIRVELLVDFCRKEKSKTWGEMAY